MLRPLQPEYIWCPGRWRNRNLPGRNPSHVLAGAAWRRAGKADQRDSQHHHWGLEVGSCGSSTRSSLPVLDFWRNGCLLSSRSSNVQAGRPRQQHPAPAPVSDERATITIVFGAHQLDGDIPEFCGCRCIDAGVGTEKSSAGEPSRIPRDSEGIRVLPDVRVGHSTLKDIRTHIWDLFGPQCLLELG